MQRRMFLGSMAAALAGAAGRLPANRNVKWALSLALWGHFRQGPFTDILDVMKDTGFIGIRVTRFPAFLETYGITLAQLERELSKRSLQVVTISFNGPAHDPAQQKRVLESAREAMKFLAGFGAKHLVVFPPSRSAVTGNWDASFATMCQTFNRIGEVAGEMGFRAGLHNHVGQMVETPVEIDKCMSMTDPKLFWFSPDTAHLLLGGSNVVEMFARYKRRIMFFDYKDARWTTPTADVHLDNGRVLAKDSREAKFFESIYDLGDGDVDFPGCQRVLKEIQFQGWSCVDLDRARVSPRRSYERCGEYVVTKLEPIYA
jgi:inosose dehydratase